MIVTNPKLRMSERMQIRGFQGCGRVGSKEQGLNNNSMDDGRSSAFRSGVSEIMNLCAAPSSIKPELERVLSRTIKQEVEFTLSGQRILSSKKWDSDNQTNLTGPRSLRLQFRNKLSLPVLTGVPIKGGEYPLIVDLVDGLSGEVIKFGPEASAKVEIVVLEADFGGHEGESWTREDFTNKIVEKEGNKRLLTGNRIVNLKEGIGFLSGISFAHTRRWMKQQEYRLGARIKEDYNGTSIREGITEAFLVKDKRLDCNKKHYPPSLSDPVWRLEKIARDGPFHNRLNEENIFTVKDFLTQLNINPQKLRDILKTSRMFEVTVDHAQTCILDKDLYFYGSSPSHQKNGVVFNVVGQVAALLSDSQYVSYNIMSQTEKDKALNLVAPAFQHWEDVVPFDESLSSSITESSIGSTSLSDIGCLLKSSITGSSIGTKISTSLITGEHDFTTSDGTFQETMRSYESIWEWDVNCYHGSSICTKISTSQITDELDTLTPGGSYQETMPSCDHSLDMIIHDRYNVQSDDHVVQKRKRPLSSSSKSTDSDNLDLETIIRSFPEEGDDLPQQFSVGDGAGESQGLILESLANNTMGNLVGEMGSKLSGSDNLDMETMIRSFPVENDDLPQQFSVVDGPVESQGLNLESFANNAMGNLIGEMGNKLSVSYVEIMSSPSVTGGSSDLVVYSFKNGDDVVGEQPSSFSCQVTKPLIRGKDFVRRTFNESKDQAFSSQIPLISRNLGLKKYKAQVRWCKLYSVMRWFLVWRMKKRASSQHDIGTSEDDIGIYFLGDKYSLNDDHFASAGDTDLNQHNSKGQFSTAGSFCNNSTDLQTWELVDKEGEKQ